MQDEVRWKDYPFPWPGPATRSRPQLVLLAFALSALLSVALCAVAIAMRAPAPAAPLVALICVGGPLFAAWEAPGALAAMRADRARRAGHRAMAKLRQRLDQLPETEHPLGL